MYNKKIDKSLGGIQPKDVYLQMKVGHFSGMKI